jgi:hypothetical protein
VISKGFEAQEPKIASLSSRVASLEEEIGRLSGAKKRKAIPNPNRKFMTLAEALVAGDAILEPNQAAEETEAVEEVIEVGRVEENERRKSYLSHACALGAQLRGQENIKINSILNWKIAINLLFLFSVTLCEGGEK